MHPEEKPDVDEIVFSLKTMLRTPVSDDELRAEVDMYVNKYLMDAESAKIGTIKDITGSLRDYVPPASDPKKMSELRVGERCTVSGMVVSEPSRRSVNDTPIMEFDATDDTGTVRVTVWSPDKDVTLGESYTFRSVKVTVFKGVIGISVNTNALTSYEGEPFKGGLTGAGELKTGMKNVTVRGTITRIFNRSANPDAPTQSGLFQMDGGSLRFSHWGGYNLGTGEYVISGVEIKDNHGEREIRLPKNNRARRVS